MASKSSNNKIIVGTLVVLGIFASVIYFGWAYLYQNVARPFQIKGKSMSPNYNDGQYYLTSLINQNTKLQRGDVIIFKAPQEPDKDFDKRIIALSGDRLMIQNGEVYLNGELLNEPYIVGKTYSGDFLKEGETINVPDGNFFVMGDNRSYSSDSRSWGFVPAANIISIMGTCYNNCK